jgi:hypothetical protein
MHSHRFRGAVDMRPSTTIDTVVGSDSLLGDWIRLNREAKVTKIGKVNDSSRAWTKGDNVRRVQIAHFFYD